MPTLTLQELNEEVNKDLGDYKEKQFEKNMLKKTTIGRNVAIYKF